MAVTGGAAALIGALSFLGQATGLPLLPAIPRDAPPIALWASAGLALLGLGAAALALVPRDRAVRRAAALGAGVALAAALLAAVAYLAIPALDPDRLLTGVAGVRWTVRTGFSHPLASPAIGLAAAALLLLAAGRFRDVAGALALVVAVAGLAACLGFFYGSPIALHAGGPIPLAAGVAVTLLGIALLALAGPAAWPLRPMAGDSVRAVLLRGFVPLVVLAVLVTDLATVLLFSRYSGALGSAVNALGSAAVTVLVVSSLARVIGGRIERSEQALRESEERFRLLSDASFAGVAITDGATLVDCNEDLTSLLGYTRAEMLGRPLADFVAPEHAGLVPWHGHAGGGDAGEATPRHEYLMRRKDGTTFRVEAQGRAIPYGGRRVRVTAIRDISERQRVEEALRQAQRMEAVGQLAGGLAHDFNNLLTAVQASGALLEAGLPQDSPLRRDVETIRGAAQRGAELTGKLLAYGRRQPLRLRPVAARSAVQNLVHLARRVVPASVSITLESEADAGAATILADPGALDQILLNCITNARDAMPAGGAVAIALGRVTVDPAHPLPDGWTRPGAFVTIAVTDTGVGMDAETRRRAFEPFFTTKPVGQGTGLGLAIVYGLIRQHDGHVAIESQPGRGTTVRIWLPAAAEEAEPPVAAPDTEVRGGHETILVVEDDEPVRRATVRVLETFGYDVAAAGDGLEALALLQDGRRRPDLILSDIVMPRLGGPQMLARLREAGAAPKTVFTSGYSSPEAPERVGLDPAARVLTKPWTVPELLRAVRGALDG